MSYTPSHCPFVRGGFSFPAAVHCSSRIVVHGSSRIAVHCFSMIVVRIRDCCVGRPARRVVGHCQTLSGFFVESYNGHCCSIHGCFVVDRSLATFWLRKCWRCPNWRTPLLLVPFPKWSAELRAQLFALRCGNLFWIGQAHPACMTVLWFPLRRLLCCFPLFSLLLGVPLAPPGGLRSQSGFFSLECSIKQLPHKFDGLVRCTSL